jgi:hypothetical protein
LLPPAGVEFCGAVVTVLVPDEPLFDVVLESSPDALSSEVEVVVFVPVVVFAVPVVGVEAASAAVCATPAMRPMVTAPAAAATP